MADGYDPDCVIFRLAEADSRDIESVGVFDQTPDKVGMTLQVLKLMQNLRE